MTGPLALAPGAAAPDFEFDAGGGAGPPLRLVEACRSQGAFVCFFALADAPVSQPDVAALAGAAAELGAPGRPLLLVSVDAADHGRRFLAERRADGWIHVSDPTLAIAARYAVRRAEGFAAPASFLVGRDGRIVAAALHPIGFPRPIALLKQWLVAAGLDPR